MERKLLTEYQQNRTNAINAMIARGVMPTEEELRGAGRNALQLGCPEHLLRSVVAKNAALFRARANGSTEQRTVPTSGERFEQWSRSRQVSRMAGEEVQRQRHTQEESQHREQFNNLILGL